MEKIGFKNLTWPLKIAVGWCIAMALASVWYILQVFYVMAV